MHLVTYATDGESRGGILLGATIVDLADAHPDRDADAPAPPLGIREALEQGIVGPRLAERAFAVAAAGGGRPLGSVRLGPPVPDPDKILCVGLNYRDHAEESGLAEPPEPMIFAKFRNSLVGPADEVLMPGMSEQIDFEGELAVVIGRRAKNIVPDDALSHLAGAMVFNDVTARDIQHATSQWTTGKAIDTFAPCGPALVTLDEIGSLDGLRIRTRVNGRVVQDGDTSDMIFGVPHLVSHLSRTMTLVPGDIIATGTPAGVGASRRPPLFLRGGDVVEVEIDRVGNLRNPVSVSAPTATAATS